MKRVFILVALFAIASSALLAQQYPKVKVTLNSGLVVKGSKATITDQSVLFLAQGSQSSYLLTDVQLIQAKEGKAGKWAFGCGGGCLALCIVAGVVSGSEGIEEAGGDIGTYILGSAIWTGVFAGIGALIGSASDKYETVYLPNHTSWMNRLNLSVTNNNFRYINFNNDIAKYNLTLSFKF